MRDTVFVISMIAGLATLMEACVIVPLPSKRLLTDERLGQLVVGTTTRDEVYAMFGDQYWHDPGGSGVVYSKDRLTAFAASAWGAGTFEAVENLYVDFDDQNILSHFERFEFIDGKACVETGVCMIGDIRGGSKTLTSIAFSRPPGEDLKAKQFNRVPDQCSVYLYGDASLNATYQVAGALHQICLNEQSMTALYSPDLYLNLHLPPGTHRLAVGNAFAWHYTNGLVFNRDDEDLLTVSKILYCEPGAVHFFRIEEMAELKGLFVEKYISTRFALESVDEPIGRTAVTRRNLASDALDVRLDPGADDTGKGKKCFDLQ